MYGGAEQAKHKFDAAAAIERNDLTQGFRKRTGDKAHFRAWLHRICKFDQPIRADRADNGLDDALAGRQMGAQRYRS